MSSAQQIDTNSEADKKKKMHFPKSNKMSVCKIGKKNQQNEINNNRTYQQK